ncbi:MAG: hypothetical protein GY869_13035, partial [Planctomycetes bacterium]|nr:hypothetical protein [Planctomycetota bacterium]
MEIQNKSELLFEKYLNANGFCGRWVYEPSIQGKNKRPDYLLDHCGQEYFFEVKELRKKDNEPTEPAAHIDPYTGLRQDIHKAKKQFKEYKEYCCSLVVFNIDDRQARLDPRTILGAMLGNLGFSMDFNADEGEVVEDTAKNVFLDGGKMIDDKSQQPRNTTISSIIVLEEFHDDSEINKAIREESKKKGKPLTCGEKIEFIKNSYHRRHTTSSLMPRVVVVENPYARFAFPEDLFVGQFDERWRRTEENGATERIFVG